MFQTLLRFVGETLPPFYLREQTRHKLPQRKEIQKSRLCLVLEHEIMVPESSEIMYTNSIKTYNTEYTDCCHDSAVNTHTSPHFVFIHPVMECD